MKRPTGLVTVATMATMGTIGTMATMAAAIAATITVAFLLAAGVTVRELKNASTEIALLETENTARRVTAAMQLAEIWNGKGFAAANIVQSSNPPPAALWGLERWPQGNEIFFVTRGTDSFLIRKNKVASKGNIEGKNEGKNDIFEFALVGAQDLFTRAMGAQKNVEWLLADAVNSAETSLATIESGEASRASHNENRFSFFGTLTSATVAVPGTNTIVRRFFVFSYRDLFYAPLFWSVATVVAGSVLAALAAGVIISKRAFNRRKRGVSENENEHKIVAEEHGLTDGKQFFARLLACSQNSFVKEQCIILLSPDQVAAASVQKRATITATVAEELSRACIHGPVAAKLEAEHTCETSADKDNVAPLLFAIHCPHFEASKALSFAEHCRTKLESRPEMVFGTPQITFSAAVAEFHGNVESAEEFQNMLAELLQSTALMLRKIQENGGGTTALATECIFGSKGCS